MKKLGFVTKGSSGNIGFHKESNIPEEILLILYFLFVYLDIL